MLTSKKLLILLFLAFSFSMGELVKGESVNIYSENFSTFTNGDLSGQNGWNGIAAWKVSDLNDDEIKGKYITASTSFGGISKTFISLASTTELKISFNYKVITTGTVSNNAVAYRVNVLRCNNLACSSTTGISTIEVSKTSSAGPFLKIGGASLNIGSPEQWNYAELDLDLTTGVVRYRNNNVTGYTTGTPIATSSNDFGMALQLDSPSDVDWTVRLDSFGAVSSYVASTSPNSSVPTTAPIQIETTYVIGDNLTGANGTVRWTVRNEDNGSQFTVSGGTFDSTYGEHVISGITPSNLANGFYTIWPEFFLEGAVNDLFGSVARGHFLIGTTTLSQTAMDEATQGAALIASLDDVNYPCSVTELSGCLKNVGLFLFKPTVGVTQKFQELDLSDKFPFVYAYQIVDLRDALFTAPSTASTSIGVNVPNFGTITFLSKTMIDSVPYASLIKTILGYILYILCAEYIYYRVIRAHNPNT